MSIRDKIDSRLDELKQMVDNRDSVSERQILDMCLSIKKFNSVLSTEEREYVNSIYTFFDEVPHQELVWQRNINVGIWKRYGQREHPYDSWADSIERAAKNFSEMVYFEFDDEDEIEREGIGVNVMDVATEEIHHVLVEVLYQIPTFVVR